MNVRLFAGGAVAIALVLTGCGGTSPPAPVGSGAARVVRVVERDFQIHLTHRVAAGNVVFAVHNAGPDEHELIVVRLSGNPLPVRSDGITIDEAKLGTSEVGLLEPGPPGSERDLRLDLPPGRYRLFCNMYGHYMAGMSADLVVS